MEKLLELPLEASTGHVDLSLTRVKRDIVILRTVTIHLIYKMTRKKEDGKIPLLDEVFIAEQGM
tara:strand:+ start:922 stop:1113 length:192 start_codon:yes stop_codon:yes gene_type:complete